MQALGIDVDSIAYADASASMTAGQQVLEQLMSPVLRTLCYENSRVRLSCMPFLTGYLARVRNASKRLGGIDTSLRPQLLQVMEVLSLSLPGQARSQIFSVLRLACVGSPSTFEPMHRRFAEAVFSCALVPHARHI